MTAIRLIACLLSGWASACVAAYAQVELLRNPGFEHVPGAFVGQGLVPSEWLVLYESPDTYSSDGSYGLHPADYGNFTDVQAHQGIRWVAGWSAAIETFGQMLTNPLVPGHSYRLTAFLHTAVRGDLANAGTYRIDLRQSGSEVGLVVGEFPSVSSPSDWEFRTLTFTAPPEANTHPILAFVPIKSGAGECYPGCDDVSLVDLTQSPGDANGDGCVDDADLTAVILDFGFPPSGANGDTDFNDDGIVDDADITIVIMNFGMGC